jgi:hypothetical protein
MGARCRFRMRDQRAAVRVAADQMLDAEVIAAAQQVDGRDRALRPVDDEHRAIVGQGRDDDGRLVRRQGGGQPRGQGGDGRGVGRGRTADPISGQLRVFPFTCARYAAALLAERP